MKSLNHDTYHLSRLASDDKQMADDEDADAFMLLYFLTTKQHMGPPLVNRQVSNLLVVHFIIRLSLETKPRPKSWPTLSIVRRRLKRWSHEWTHRDWASYWRRRCAANVTAPAACECSPYVTGYIQQSTNIKYITHVNYQMFASILSQAYTLSAGQLSLPSLRGR